LDECRWKCGERVVDKSIAFGLLCDYNKILKVKIKIAMQKEPPMARCETCKLRAKYDKNPKSLLGRFWKWHIGWCPGWRSYVKSLPDDKKAEMGRRYSG
jgi:hypothetical protein